MLSLDFIELMPVGCSVQLNFYHYLLLRTLLPLAVAAGALIARLKYLRAAKAEGKEQAGAPADLEESSTVRRVAGGAAAASQQMADRLLTWVFLLFYLVYPSVSSKLFATFQCTLLDDGLTPEESTRILTADLSLDCDATWHGVMQFYAVVMLFVYPFGMPALYAYLLFYKHNKQMVHLKNLEARRVALREEVLSKNKVPITADNRPTTN